MLDAELEAAPVANRETLKKLMQNTLEPLPRAFDLQNSRRADTLIRDIWDYRNPPRK